MRPCQLGQMYQDAQMSAEPRRNAGLPAHAYAVGDIVKLKGDRVTLYKVTQLLDTTSGTGYMVVPAYNGAFKAVKDDKVKERTYTAAEWEDDQEERSNG